MAVGNEGFPSFGFVPLCFVHSFIQAEGTFFLCWNLRLRIFNVLNLFIAYVWKVSSKRSNPFVGAHALAHVIFLSQLEHRRQRL